MVMGSGKPNEYVVTVRSIKGGRSNSFLVVGYDESNVRLIVERDILCDLEGEHEIIGVERRSDCLSMNSDDDSLEERLPYINWNDDFELDDVN